MHYINGAQVGVRVVNRVVFREQFTGDGSTVEFALAGSSLNATWRAGGWTVDRVLNTLPSYATNTSGSPVYDGLVPLVRHKATVGSINATTGIVTLDYAPRNGVDFYIWYWYELHEHDILEDYYREDIVTSMEQEEGAGSGVLVLLDQDASNELSVSWEEDDTNDRQLALKVNGGNRSLTLEDNAILDQDLTQDASPTFTDISLTNRNLISYEEAAVLGTL